MFDRIRSKVIPNLLMFCTFVFASMGVAAGQTQQLPISDFVNVLSPTNYQIWTDPSVSPENWMHFDMYGRLGTTFNLGLGTTVDGGVTVQNFRNGTRQVTVRLHTRNAICWGTANANSIPAFGYSPGQVASGATASTGHGVSKIVYSRRSNALPLFGGPQESFSVTIMCDGVLRAGSGHPEGTEGFAHTTQVGLYSTGVEAGCPPEQDGNCFPAEKIIFSPRGQ